MLSHILTIKYVKKAGITVSGEANQVELLKWISIADRYIKIQLDRRLKPLKLSSSNYYYLLRLHERPGITQEGLIDLMFLNRSNVTRSINQLVNIGIVRKEIVTSDRRMSKLYLTDHGESLCPQVTKIREDVVTQAIQDAGERSEGLVTAMRAVAQGAVTREQKFDAKEVEQSHD